MTCTLLTGGFGYIGSHTATILAEKNQKFFIIDNFINCKKDVVDKLERITKQKVHFCKVDVRVDRVLIAVKHVCRVAATRLVARRALQAANI